VGHGHAAKQDPALLLLVHWQRGSLTRSWGPAPPPRAQRSAAWWDARGSARTRSVAAAGHRRPSLGSGLRTQMTRGPHTRALRRGQRTRHAAARRTHARRACWGGGTRGTETGAARDLALLQHVHLRAPQRSVACGLLAGALGHNPGARAYMELEVAPEERTPVRHQRWLWVHLLLHTLSTVPTPCVVRSGATMFSKLIPGDRLGSARCHELSCLRRREHVLIPRCARRQTVPLAAMRLLRSATTWTRSTPATTPTATPSRAATTTPASGRASPPTSKAASRPDALAARRLAWRA
jgi:hypothetical protein